MFDKIVFGSVWPTEGVITMPVARLSKWRSGLSSVPYVFEFRPFRLGPGAMGSVAVLGVRGLDAGHLVGAHNMDSVFIARWSHGSKHHRRR